jgi:zinc/manganese transport system permease protein
VLLLVWFTIGDRLGPLGFYMIFAVAVTASVQIVGIYLVFASLIIPALATMDLSGGIRLLVGYTIGALSYFVGIALSAIFDFPTGAIIVWTMAAIALVGGLSLQSKSSVS